MTSIEAKRSGSEVRSVSQIGKQKSTQDNKYSALNKRKTNLPAGSPATKQYTTQLEAVKDVAPDKE